MSKSEFSQFYGINAGPGEYRIGIAIFAEIYCRIGRILSDKDYNKFVRLVCDYNNEKLDKISVSDFLYHLFWQYKMSRKLVIHGEPTPSDFSDLKNYFFPMEIALCTDKEETHNVGVYKVISQKDIDKLKFLILEISSALKEEGISNSFDILEPSICLDDYPIEYRFSLEANNKVCVCNYLTVPLTFDDLLGAIYKIFLELEEELE